MGVVRRQSILSGILIYAGFAIGALNILVLFQRHLTPEQIGLTRILLDVGMVLSAVFGLAAVPLVQRFSPFYQSYLPERRNDLPFLTLALGAVGCLMLFLLLPRVEPWMVRKFGARSPLFVHHFDLVYPLTASLVFFAILEAHAWSRKRTVLSNGLKEFGYRLLTTGLILTFIAGGIDFDTFIKVYAWLWWPGVVVLAIVLRRAGALGLHPVPSRVTRRVGGRMVTYGGVLLGAVILNIVARTNDTIILASQSAGGLADAAVFTIATYLVTVMDVPQRSLVSISTPFIAEAWKDGDMARIARLYRKTSLNLMLAGIAIFAVVLLNLEDLTDYMGPGYGALTLLVVVSGLGKMADLSTGLNTQVLLLSRHWRADFMTNVMLVALSIPLNYWLTRRYNVMGPAYGNLIALFVFNGVRLGLIWHFFRLQPFSGEHLKGLGLGLAALLAGWVVPPTGSLAADVCLRSAVFALAFGAGVLRFRVSTDLREVVDGVRARLRRNGP